MNALVCEMCGSNEIVKEDGYYVCKMCDTKYSVEEARRMMIEGNVNVQGTVKIDNSEIVERCLINARRAKQKEDWEEAVKYYSKVEENDPSNVEAIFYGSFAKVKASLTNPDLYKRKAVFNTLEKCMEIIKQSYDFSREEEIRPVFAQIGNDVILLSKGSFTYNQTRDANGNVTTDKYETTKLFAGLVNAFAVASAGIADKVPSSAPANKIFYYKLIIQHFEYRMTLTGKNQQTINTIMDMHERIKALDPNYVVPERPSSGGCYVATAVYGSYDCPQVWTLRRFRDYTLAETWYGRAFIHTYYAISPTIVKLFGETEWFKNMWRGKLDKMVADLNEKGVDDTPYEDKIW